MATSRPVTPNIHSVMRFIANGPFRIATSSTCRFERYRQPRQGYEMNASQKVALVTGATRGIGHETVRQLAEAGVTTLLAGRDTGRAKAAAEKLKAEGLPVEPITLDATDAATIQKAVDEVKIRFGKLDIL